ncbi:hypothetical protein [Salinigranum rubrum]|uniref:hypothetical protein n=1 Tax=Salinigranum rubrum TaxID=755307 RepID=UPI001FEAB6AD|nr:hypothetical protein [Salinigranum rubrum]
MASELSALDPKELVLVAIAILGLIPVLKLNTERAKLFTGGYLLLCLGAVATNAEALFLGDVLNGVEHIAGLLGSGVVFLAAAYLRRQQIIHSNENDTDDAPSVRERVAEVAGASGERQ